jgi:hypothetical protein
MVGCGTECPKQARTAEMLPDKKQEHKVLAHLVSLFPTPLHLSYQVSFSFLHLIFRLGLWDVSKKEVKAIRFEIIHSRFNNLNIILFVFHKNINSTNKNIYGITEKQFPRPRVPLVK